MLSVHHLNRPQFAWDMTVSYLECRKQLKICTVHCRRDTDPLTFLERKNCKKAPDDFCFTYFGAIDRKRAIP